MLRDLGCRYVIVGHSERRHHFGETDAQINRKVTALLHCDLPPILCVGETLEQRRDGKTFEILAEQVRGAFAELGAEQVSGLVVAYEPVWAIGTGHTATPEQAQEAHAFLRQTIGERFTTAVANEMRILYGGSVKPDNVDGLMAQRDIDGALVGGASLKASSFLGIVAFTR
jgi:triosephosphate isomerase